ncbi:hypothetical protein [Mesorhizobium loti]|uniref:hypothetical protein n=1 Tax=Rhizobium loti TaxID=381 RepID=UPI0012681727|nr:hypothetical protein [Mesorhizobium loti]
MNTRYRTPTHSSSKLGKLEAVLCLLDDLAKLVDHPRLSHAEKRGIARLVAPTLWGYGSTDLGSGPIKVLAETANG